ncbi:MAG: hypothetical protein RLZZ214_1592 [Verrucomicrobiota bacterium]
MTGTAQAGVNINGATSYTGNTIVNGTLIVSNTNALPNFTNSSRTGDVYVNGTLGLSGLNNSTVRINGLYGNGRITTPFSNNETLIVGDNNATSTFAGTITQTTGAIGLTKIGTGALTLSGTNSTWTAATNIQNGVVSVVTLNNVGTPNATSSLGRPTTAITGTIGLGSTTTTGILKVVGTGETTDRIINLAGTTGGGTIDQSGTGLLLFTNNFTATGGGSKSLTLSGSTAGTGEISGGIVDNSGTNKTSLAKSGTGTWELSGTNTYTGTTSVNEGKLVINGNSSTATGNVSVAASATLGGSGLVGGATTINGILAPGNSIGTITIGNDVTWNDNDSWVFELGSSASTLALAGSGSSVQDFLNITGGGSDFLKGSGASFTFDFANTGMAGFYKIVDWAGTTGFVAGDFIATNIAGGATGTFTVDSGTSALYLTVVPEPDAAMLVGGLGMLALLRRRRTQ